eukprot:CAMPEP_0116546270 /NCGR_PEP_ID=MMETSP0397-20121206/3136_1 /TAXON_ID=216820 /ORGANISM="Cyclophora tenuis, Strain ECT3854" /LENGTH=213 /DNA_ID=CAMNT_0004070687 /DNA_START=1 /DNA_END=643 /DNA_ORIENTATION=-
MAHRFMLVCQERHQGAIDYYHEELASVTERLSHSPMIREISQTMDRVPDEGIMSVGIGAIQNGASLLGRWWSGGIDTAVNDLTYATNWDGRFNAPVLGPTSVAPPEVLTEKNCEDVKKAPVAQVEEHGGQVEEPERDPLPGMPCCPITGEPMLDPVVAADGHTYERSAIARWLQTSDKSPMTGSLLPHKELVANYVLLSSLAEATVAKSGMAL